VVDNATGRCVGEAVLYQWAEADATCRFRILVGPHGRDRGLGTEATRLMLGHGFTALGLRRITLDVYAFKPAGPPRLREGRLRRRRRALRFDDRWIDAVTMSATRP
jgi:hypothetical protein